MGLPALVLPQRTPRPAGTSATRGRRAPSSGRATEARCRAAFNAFALAVCVLALVGVARVALAAHAFEASFDSTALMSDIKEERLASDKLEADRSALTTPSRIERIAGDTMSMVCPNDVRYVSLLSAQAAAPGRVAEGAAPAVQSGPEDGGLASAVAAAMSMAAGEAQVLLVGDVGLASSR